MILAGSAIVGSNASVARAAHAFGSDEITIALVGCGKRGTAAASQAINTANLIQPSGSVRLIAMADCFQSSIQKSYRTLRGKHGELIDVKHARFSGLDGFRNVMQTEADVVILATPPGFRPLHFEAAVAAGKHVFMEKPVATDAAGVRRVMAAGKLAEEKGLAVQVGFQRRHEPGYLECIERLRSGMIGDPVFARAYWNGSPNAIRARRAKQTELEYQLCNWHQFNWLSGDMINEQHVHNLDVINWLMGEPPIEAQGQGGRDSSQATARHAGSQGQVFNHHMVEFTYANGARLLSQCRQMPGCWNSVGEHVHATHGSADISAGKIVDRNGNVIWKGDEGPTKGRGWQHQQNDLFLALREGRHPNETEQAAVSTMTAIMGRMATYTGKRVRWSEALNCDQSLAEIDAIASVDHPAPVTPDADGVYPVPVPGDKTLKS